MAKQIETKDISVVKELLQKVAGKSEYAEIERMGGLTNRTYKVMFAEGDQYIVRIPGEGTEKMIVRGDERVSTELACDLEIDAKLLYFGEDGAKVTEFIEDAVTMSAETMREKENIKEATVIFRKLHTCGVDTKVPFEVFDMAKSYEKIIFSNNVDMFDDYEEIKITVMKIKAEVDSMCDIRKVPCHNDALCENWVKSGYGRMYLIDWEYAGMNDGLWDLAEVSIEAAYGHSHDELFLTEYFGKEPSDADWKHFLANKLYVDYLWTLWAKTRVPFDGQPMEDWAEERYERLKKNIDIFNEL